MSKPKMRSRPLSRNRQQTRNHTPLLKLKTMNPELQTNSPTIASSLNPYARAPQAHVLRSRNQQWKMFRTTVSIHYLRRLYLALYRQEYRFLVHQTHRHQHHDATRLRTKLQRQSKYFLLRPIFTRMSLRMLNSIFDSASR